MLCRNTFLPSFHTINQLIVLIFGAAMKYPTDIFAASLEQHTCSPHKVMMGFRGLLLHQVTKLEVSHFVLYEPRQMRTYQLYLK